MFQEGQLFISFICQKREDNDIIIIVVEVISKLND